MEKKFGFCTMRLPLNDPDNPGNVDLERIKPMFDAGPTVANIDDFAEYA